MSESEGAAQGPAQPYGSPEEHLRDELWRVWLRVEYRVRSRWEAGTIPRVTDETTVAAWNTDQLSNIFRHAHGEYLGTARGDGQGDSATLLAAYQRHATLIDQRVAATRDRRAVPLVEISDRFALSRAQRAALTVALMTEVDPHLLIAYRYLSHDPNIRGVDGRLLALMIYDTAASRAHLSRDLSPRSPLLFYRLLELDEGTRESMLYRRLRPAARLVQKLVTEVDELDPDLSDVAELRSGQPGGLWPDELVQRVTEALRGERIALILQGSSGVGKRLLVETAAQRLGMKTLLIDAARFGSMPADEQRPMLRSLLREARLLSAVPVLYDIDDAIAQLGERGDMPAFVGQLAREHVGPVVLTVCRDKVPRLARPTINVNVANPSLTERRALWRQEVSGLTEVDAAALAERFAVTGGVIAMSAQAALVQGSAGRAPSVGILDAAVRTQLHDRIVRLGKKIETPYSFDDLVVDDDVMNTLCEIIACVRERRTVREKWGLRGAPGVSVLFSGDPGVGKSMSASVLARQLNLAIYEIDLSQVVSKWVGETEKNLAEVFDAAEPGHVVLLFNEADSLFGKRTAEVSSANDRFANLQTNYLLQRLERFGGLAILTTNLSKAIDSAFRRRFAYDVQFSFPSVEMRAELWRRAIPAKAAAASINFHKLAEQFSLSGGFIKVAIERAAFLSAAVGEPITYDSITMTVERMYQERGKLIASGKLDS